MKVNIYITYNKIDIVAVYSFAKYIYIPFCNEKTTKTAHHNLKRRKNSKSQINFSATFRTLIIISYIYLYRCIRNWITYSFKFSLALLTQIVIFVWFQIYRLDGPNFFKILESHSNQFIYLSAIFVKNKHSSLFLSMKYIDQFNETVYLKWFCCIERA